MGEAPDSIVLVESVAGRRDARPSRRHEARLRHADDALGRRDRRDDRARCGGASRRSTRRSKEDICYATSNRQWAVKEMLGEIDLLLVIGSRNSSNSNRLVETSRARRRAVVPDRRRDRDRRGLARRRRDRRHHLGRLGAGEARRAACATGSATRGVDRHRAVPASSRRTSSSAFRSSCAASSRSPTRSDKDRSCRPGRCRAPVLRGRRRLPAARFAGSRTGLEPLRRRHRGLRRAVPRRLEHRGGRTGVPLLRARTLYRAARQRLRRYGARGPAAGAAVRCGAGRADRHALREDRSPRAGDDRRASWIPARARRDR